MTAYFMHFFKKIKIIVISVAILLLVAMANKFTLYDDNKILIKDVMISKNNNLYNVSFIQELKLDDLIKEAIDKGIPLVFKLTLKIVKLNNISLDNTIKKEVRYYQIKYKALRKIYRIIDINEEKYEYKNLDQAIQKMLKVENLEFSFVDDGMNYELWLNVSLDRKKLPKPLQVNFFNKTWSMSSGNSIHKMEN